MIKELKQRLSSLMTTPSTTSLNKAVFDLDTEKAQLLQRLFPLREGTVKPVSMQEAGKVDAEMRILVEFEHKRKKIEHKMWMYLREVLPEGYEVAELRVSSMLSHFVRRAAELISSLGESWARRVSSCPNI